MPKHRKITVEEMKALTPTVTGERARIREEYRGYLSDLEVGEGGELELGSDEKKVTVKNRLKRAADDLNMSLEFRRSGYDLVRYCIVDPQSAAPKARGGRRKSSK